MTSAIRRGFSFTTIFCLVLAIIRIIKITAYTYTGFSVDFRSFFQIFRENDREVWKTTCLNVPAQVDAQCNASNIKMPVETVGRVKCWKELNIYRKTTSWIYDENYLNNIVKPSFIIRVCRILRFSFRKLMKMSFPVPRKTSDI